MTTQIHTDGSCHGNPGPGGWAAIILTQDGRGLTLKGGAPETTNNRMELNAVIQGLRSLGNMPEAERGSIAVHTDSRYVVDAFEKGWIENWQQNGWRTAGGKPVKNQDLWAELIPLVQQWQPRWRWVRGHSGDHWNETCDRIANEQAGLAGWDDPAPDPETGNPDPGTGNPDPGTIRAILEAEGPNPRTIQAILEGPDPRAIREIMEDEEIEESPGSYGRGYQDGYETALAELAAALNRIRPASGASTGGENKKP